MNILLLAPSGAFAAALDSLAIDKSTDAVIMVSAVASDLPEHTPQVLLGPRALPPAGRILKRLNATVVGRNLRRLPPLDGGHRFAARARHEPRLRSAVEKADIIVALERDAVLAAWTGLRRWAPAHARAVYGLAPARAVLASIRASQH